MTRQPCRGLLAAALLLVLPAAGLAHDPGLSSLEVRVTRSHVVADLSLAAVDAKGLTGHSLFALQAIDLRIDGVQLHGTIEETAIESGGSLRVRLRYERAAGSRLVVRSAVADRLARGHRELLSIRGEDGTLLSERMLDAEANEEAVDLRILAGGDGIAIRFFTLGIEHIVRGYDHLLFLAGLLIVVRGRRHVIRTVTAFTIAHSLTLAAAVVGLVHVPAGIVEPLIAASIVYVGVENLLRPQMNARSTLTFAFGLIHGFGFAGALRDLGIGSGAAGIGVPLAAFNIGVEAGQIAVALVMLPLVWRVQRIPVLSARLAPICSTAVVLAGAYWLIERTIASLYA